MRQSICVGTQECWHTQECCRVVGVSSPFVRSLPSYRIRTMRNVHPWAGLATHISWFCMLIPFSRTGPTGRGFFEQSNAKCCCMFFRPYRVPFCKNPTHYILSLLVQGLSSLKGLKERLRFRCCVYQNTLTSWTGPHGLLLWSFDCLPTV